MPRLLHNKVAVARDQSVSRQTVHAWMRDPRWTLGQRFPLDGERIDAWRAETLSPSDSGPSPPSEDHYALTRRRVELQHRAEQTLYLRQRRAILENKYIERELHDRALMGLVGEFRRRIQDWLEALPPLFAHQSEVQIRSLFTDAYDRLCEEMMQMSEVPLAGEAEVARLKNHTKHQAADHKHHGERR